MDYKDLMAGVDHAIERGLADPERLGIYGLSYGGYMTCFTVGQTSRFKAADYRCPAGQSEQFYAHLKANACIVEMLRVPNLAHAGMRSGPIKAQKAQNEALLGWMDKYVLGA